MDLDPEDISLSTVKKTEPTSHERPHLQHGLWQLEGRMLGFLSQAGAILNLASDRLCSLDTQNNFVDGRHLNGSISPWVVL